MQKGKFLIKQCTCFRLMVFEDGQASIIKGEDEIVAGYDLDKQVWKFDPDRALGMGEEFELIVIADMYSNPKQIWDEYYRGE